MALSFVGSAAAATTSVALPSFVAGDIALVSAFRDGSNTSPSLATGWTEVHHSGQFSCAMRVGYRILQASDTTTGTWTNATEVQVIVLRGQLTAANPIGSAAAAGANSNQMSYTGFSIFASGSPQGASWVVGMSAHTTATGVNSEVVTGMTNRSASLTTMAIHVDESVSDPWPTTSFDTTVNASSGWRSVAVEIRAAAGTTQTGTAQLSLAGGNPPTSRTGHVVNVRARTSSGTGTIRAQLYEGASTRSAVLETSTLSTSLTDYALAIADSDAATITSYADLELRIWGYSASGSAAVFEVARASLQTPASAGAQTGRSALDLVFGSTTSGTVTGAGAKTTGFIQFSLAPGLTPATRTQHNVRVRARRTALQGKIRVQLYEGSNVRSGVLETGELTTSLAWYTLAIADADAATITDYSNLELRVRGYSSTGTATVFEIAEIELDIPASSTGGAIVGAAVLASSALVTAGAGTVVYPGAAIYPYPLITLASTATVTASSTHLSSGVVILPLTLGIVTDGNTPLTNRTGKALLATVVTITPVGVPVRYAASLLASIAYVNAGAAASASAGAALIASTASVTAAGVVPVAALPPDFVDVGFVDMPDLLVAIAFASEPQDPLPVYTGVSSFLRGISAKRGRQFELNRVETGTENLLLSNLDGRFSPENSSSPYYPDLIPNKRIKWHLYWNGVDYAVFEGYLAGYPQEYPDYGFDSIVRQQAVDGFMPLARTKFVPGSTVLTSVMAQISADTVETIDVGSTALPMPQAAPFEITIDGEDMTVEAIVNGTQYSVSRRLEAAIPHIAGASVTTTAVSFGQAYSGQRIIEVLQSIGVTDYDIDAGQALLTASENLAGTSPLEHLINVAEWEGGRFFSSKEGVPTFRDRHWIFKNELTSRATFGDAGGTELPYSGIQVTHEDERIFNIIRITTPSGFVTDERDQASIDNNFEQVFEKAWPLADDNEAQSAAEYLLSRYSAMQVRIPELTLLPRSSPTLLYPRVLALELGQRYRVIRRPHNDATIDKQMIVEGIEHRFSPSNMETRVQLSLADTTTYWQLGVAGYSELGTTTRLAY